MSDSIYFFIFLEIFLILLTYIFRNKRPVANFLLLFISSLAVLLVVEFVYRSFLKQDGLLNTGDSTPGYYQDDSLLGMKRDSVGVLSAVSAFTGGDTVFNTVYSIMKDTSGNRLQYNHRIGFRNAANNKEAVFIGCSFTFGEGVADTATLPYQFGTQTNLSSLNLGCPAYGTHQVYQLFLHWYGGKPNNNRIFIYSFLSDHFLRATAVYDWNANGPWFARRGDSVLYAGRMSEIGKLKYRRLPYYLSGFGAFQFIKDKLDDIFLRKRMSRFSDEDYARCMLMIRNMAKEIQKTGGRFIILNWDKQNWGFRGYDFARQKQLDEDLSRMNDRQVQVIGVSDILNLNDPANFIPNDGHPSALAYRKIASHLARAIETRN